MQRFALASLIAPLLVAFTAAYTIEPDSVPEATRDSWCTSQQTQCPLICLQTSANSAETLTNACNATTLTYGCVCSNGLSPNVSEYSQTLPFYICQEWGTQCVSNCGSDNACSYSCRADHPCGAQDPKRVNITTTSSSAGIKSTLPPGAVVNSQGTIYTGFGGAAVTGSGDGSSSTGSSGAASLRVAALSMGQTFGTLAVAGAVFGGFAVLL